MKWLTAIGFIILSSATLGSCKMPSDDNEKRAEKVSPEDILSRIPPGIPEEKGSLYEITELEGLISYGDSLLVHVSPIKSSAENNRSRHETEFRELIKNADQEGGILVGPQYGSLIRLTDNRKEGSFSYYYFEKLTMVGQENSSYILRASCASALVLYELDSSCFFGYRTRDKYIQFTLDERTVRDAKIKEIEKKVFSQLGISLDDLRWTVVRI